MQSTPYNFINDQTKKGGASALLFFDLIFVETKL